MNALDSKYTLKYIASRVSLRKGSKVVNSWVAKERVWDEMMKIGKAFRNENGYIQ